MNSGKNMQLYRAAVLPEEKEREGKKAKTAEVPARNSF
jgi:hypothetical protein